MNDSLQAALPHCRYRRHVQAVSCASRHAHTRFAAIASHPLNDSASPMTRRTRLPFPNARAEGGGAVLGSVLVSVPKPTSVGFGLPLDPLCPEAPACTACIFSLPDKDPGSRVMRSASAGGELHDRPLRASVTAASVCADRRSGHGVWFRRLAWLGGKDPTWPLKPSAAYGGFEVLTSSGFRRTVLSTCMRPGSSGISTGLRGGGQKGPLSIQGGLEDPINMIRCSCNTLCTERRQARYRFGASWDGAFLRWHAYARVNPNPHPERAQGALTTARIRALHPHLSVGGAFLAYAFVAWKEDC